VRIRIAEQVLRIAKGCRRTKVMYVFVHPGEPERRAFKGDDGTEEPSDGLCGYSPCSLFLAWRTCQILAEPSFDAVRRYGYFGEAAVMGIEVVGTGEKVMAVISARPCGRGSCVLTRYLIRSD
jgi:hypothetical protein